MTSGLPAKVADHLRQWAGSTHEIQRMWLFGSRARGTGRADSDIDVAIEIFGWDSDDPDIRGEALANWIFNADGWRDQLRSSSPLPVDLNPVSVEDERVWPAVQCDGMLIFSRA